MVFATPSRTHRLDFLSNKSSLISAGEFSREPRFLPWIVHRFERAIEGIRKEPPHPIGRFSRHVVYFDIPALMPIVDHVKRAVLSIGILRGVVHEFFKVGIIKDANRYPTIGKFRDLICGRYKVLTFEIISIEGCAHLNGHRERSMKEDACIASREVADLLCKKDLIVIGVVFGKVEYAGVLSPKWDERNRVL
jgi:hypothetical protein